jgi:hypothetical protein
VSEKAQLEEQKRSKREERTKIQKNIAQIKRLLSELQGSEIKLNDLMEKIDAKAKTTNKKVAKAKTTNKKVAKAKTTNKSKAINK